MLIIVDAICRELRRDLTPVETATREAPTLGARHRRLACPAAALLLGALTAVPAARAHDWYQGLVSPRGANCCDERDCRPVPYRPNFKCIILPGMAGLDLPGSERTASAGAA
jgi:hypothetical protein